MTDRNITRSCKAVQPSKNRKLKVGDSFVTKQGCKAIVIEYINSRKVLIEFDDKHKCRMFACPSNLATGRVKNPFHPYVCGIGYFGIGKYEARINGKLTPEYSAWNGMLARCYDEKVTNKHPTYKDCEVCEEWHNFQNFAEWYVNQKHYGLGYDLDKDIIFKGNKLYSPETCTLSPQEINKLLLENPSIRGEYPMGVCYFKRAGRFMAGVKMYGRRVHLGYFDTVEEASQAYQKAKKKHIKKVALEWKDRIDERLFDALMQRAM